MGSVVSEEAQNGLRLASGATSAALGCARAPPTCSICPLKWFAAKRMRESLPVGHETKLCPFHRAAGNHQILTSNLCLRPSIPSSAPALGDACPHCDGGSGQSRSCLRACRGSRAFATSWCNFSCRGRRRLPGRNHGRALPLVSPTALVRLRPVRFGACGDPEHDLKLLDKGAPAPRACPLCHCVSPAQPFPIDPASPTSPAGVNVLCFNGPLQGHGWFAQPCCQARHLTSPPAQGLGVQPVPQSRLRPARLHARRCRPARSRSLVANPLGWGHGEWPHRILNHLMGQVPCPHSQGLGVQPVPQSAPPPRTRTHARRRSPHAHDHQSPTLCAGGMGSGPIGFLTMVKNLMGQVPCPHSQGLGVQPVPQSAPPPRTRTHARRRRPARSRSPVANPLCWGHGEWPHR